MTDIRTPRRNRGLGTARALALASVAAVGLAVATSGSASAVVDSQNSVVDHDGNTIAAIISDTHINFVPPLDGNPLTREFFHNGRAGYKVTGPKADSWSGKVAIGYQIGYPATLSGHITVNYQTPQLEVDIVGNTGVPTADFTNILPTIGGDLSVGFGPGIVDVPATSGSTSGAEGDIALSAFHGTVTGVLGPTNIRPYVTVTSGAGDSVTTYGPIATN
ncbi:MspA family porin [Antrihabitans cavernicola]|uniref:MspA family porin n=1 Tax=Antrihabitans cavernicola TaxID=2495913 RepID=A0A5A7SH19_9NOCA|nr:MspA family porin [Spelaeibacter cavernicola]KAA0023785.1 MspA family porin [Spelaeibacter cavernicola]